MASLDLDPIDSTYDVFLSFRGEDTRHTFTDHLYHALKQAGLATFRDTEDIERGEELKFEIRRAILHSKASIVVLSENYATSTWCLDELSLILDQRRKCNHFVLPIFYHVNTSDVMKQNGNFKIEVRNASRWNGDNVSTWKAALTEIGLLAGEVLSGGMPETSFLKKVVTTVYNKLDRREVDLPRNMIGMDTRYEAISYWLDQPNSEVLVISGMGGSGKTTLARYIVYSNWRKFEKISIIEDISSRCKEPHDYVKLQDIIIGDIIGDMKGKMTNVWQQTSKIEDVLHSKKALIVLDDIVESSQLDFLLGSGNVNSESKIIITTRGNIPGEWFNSRSWRFKEYKMELLDINESLELLSIYAFRSKTPMEGFEEVAELAVQYCEGNPLALQVLGSSLSLSSTISFWNDQLRLLKNNMDIGIEKVLKRSFTSLSNDAYKELFLHIACFFVGMDVDYVKKILGLDYPAESGIQILIDKCLLSISPNKKLNMHSLIQEMGRNIVRQESKNPAKRSRVWLSIDSYRILKNGKSSSKVQGLALDMEMLKEEKHAFKSWGLNTSSFQYMDNLKLLQLNFVELNGSYDYVSEELRWLCWFGFHLKIIPSDLFLGNLVTLDMSYSKLEVFELSSEIQYLKILNLKGSENLKEIRDIFRMPSLESLILWNCQNLVHICKSIKNLNNLTLLNLTGCENISEMKQIDMFTGLDSGYSPFPLPTSLQRLFLNDCFLEYSESFHLSFRDQQLMQYLNLGGGLFRFLPSYYRLKCLRVLDLSSCSLLKELVNLPSTLAELYISNCVSLEYITFDSHQFSLQEFRYEGCPNLIEIEGFIKFVEIKKLNESDLGHMKWLKVYQYHEVHLVGDDDLTKGRSPHLQMLYEFDIMSTSLPDIKDPNMMPDYKSESSFLSFDVPLCPENMRLTGLNVTFRYTNISENDWVWFAKISTSSGVDLMYSPRVFGKPGFGEVGIWLSYWPIGNTLNVGDKVDVSISVIHGLMIHECCASLIYNNDEVENITMKNNREWVEILQRDFSRFQLSTGGYYLCRDDLFNLMELGRLTPGWLSILVGDPIDDTEVRGWRKTGRLQHSISSFTELRTVACIMYDADTEQIYKMAKAPFDNPTTFASYVDRSWKSSLRLMTPMQLQASDNHPRSTQSYDALKKLVLVLDFGSKKYDEVQEVFRMIRVFGVFDQWSHIQYLIEVLWLTSLEPLILSDYVLGLGDTHM